MPRVYFRRVFSGTVRALKGGGRWSNCPEWEDARQPFPLLGRAQHVGTHLLESGQDRGCACQTVHLQFLHQDQRTAGGAKGSLAHGIGIARAREHQIPPHPGRPPAAFSSRGRSSPAPGRGGPPSRASARHRRAAPTCCSSHPTTRTSRDRQIGDQCHAAIGVSGLRKRIRQQRIVLTHRAMDHTVHPSNSSRKVQIDQDREISDQRSGVEHMLCAFKEWRRVAPHRPHRPQH